MKKHRHRPIDEPAGDGRRESLRRVKDDLDREGEERATREDKMALNPAKLKPDREILGLLGLDGHVEISNRDPNYEYCMARSVLGDTHQVEQKLALQVNTTRGPMPTWEVVHGDMKEMIERKTAEGTRRIGDVILLRCRKDIYLVIQKWEAEKRVRQQQGATSEVEAFAHEQKGRLILHSDPNDPVLKRVLDRGFNDQMAMKRVNDNIRHGTVPGAEISEGRR